MSEPTQEPQQPKTLEERVTELEAGITSIDKKVSEMPALLETVLQKYDTSVNARFEMMRSMGAQGAGTGGNWIQMASQLIGTLTNTVQPGSAAEVNTLANRLVVMMFRQQIRTMEKNLGIADHIEFTNHP